jgi:hypothetical protein
MQAYESSEAINSAEDPGNDSDSSGLMRGVIAGIVVIVIATALALGLGIGLHSDDKTLIFVTSTTIETSKSTSLDIPTVSECLNISCSAFRWREPVKVHSWR